MLRLSCRCAEVQPFSSLGQQQSPIHGELSRPPAAVAAGNCCRCAELQHWQSIPRFAQVFHLWSFADVSFLCQFCVAQQKQQTATLPLLGAKLFASGSEASWNQRFQAAYGCSTDFGLCRNLFPDSGNNDASWIPNELPADSSTTWLSSPPMADQHLRASEVCFVCLHDSWIGWVFFGTSFGLAMVGVRTSREIGHRWIPVNYVWS